jgi:uncharacterized membrane protein
MNDLGIAIAATPGPLVTTLVMEVAPAWVLAVFGLFVLAALGAIVVLVARDTRRQTRVLLSRADIEVEEQETLPPPRCLTLLPGSVEVRSSEPS